MEVILISIDLLFARIKRFYVVMYSCSFCSKTIVVSQAGKGNDHLILFLNIDVPTGVSLEGSSDQGEFKG